MTQKVNVAEPIRVLLADDSLVIRKILTQVLSRHAELRVVGVARWGGEAVELTRTAHPDVVLLDVEMPDMNGVEAAGRIREMNPHVPIIMFSGLTSEGAKATFDAMARGATDYVAKPRSVTNLEETFHQIDAELVTKIRFWGQRRPPHRLSETPSPIDGVSAASPGIGPRNSQPEVDIVVVGVSTGGPNALAELLTVLPGPLPVPMLIVQHMPAVFTQLLAARLAQLAPHPVREAVHGEPLLPGDILIAPGNRHMRVGTHEGQHQIELDDGAPVNSCRPAVDILFDTAAKHFRSGTLGVILTGMGKDGLEGARTIKRLGGQLISQDQESSAVWGMPRAVAEAGLSDQVLPLSQIHSAIWNRTVPQPKKLIHA